MIAQRRKRIEKPLNQKNENAVLAGMTAGYSGTPLAKKLGIKGGFKMLVDQAPDHYWELLGTLPENLEILTLDEKLKDESLDFIHCFVRSLDGFHLALDAHQRLLKKDGSLWFSWYKKASKMPTDVSETDIRNFLLKNTPLVDVKICAVDENWSGLKFVYRKEFR